MLDIPPGQATLLHRHDRDMLSVFVNGGRTRASFNGPAPVEDSFTPAAPGHAVFAQIDVDVWKTDVLEFLRRF